MQTGTKYSKRACAGKEANLLNVSRAIFPLQKQKPLFAPGEGVRGVWGDGLRFNIYDI